jgi:hypothetical protein
MEHFSGRPSAQYWRLRESKREALETKDFTTDGQNRSNTGQNPPNTGQPLSLPQRVSDGQVSNTGQDESISGQNLAPKWPQRIEPECHEIIAAWRDLPDAVKTEIMAMVRRS